MIEVLDLSFLGHDHIIAAFLVKTIEGPVLIETGPHSTIDNLKAQLQKHDYKLSDIKHVLLTHIHLDHAGAAWVLAEHGANIYVHPRGYKHLADPSRLLESATRIYGDQMDYLWGTLKPIPENQLIAVEHRQKITVGGINFAAWHTPGHAVHHIGWSVKNQLLAGDVCGVKVGDGPVMPPCPPPDIHLEDWADSLALIKAKRFDAAYLTHFGKVTDVKAHCIELQGRLQNWANWIKPFYEKQVPQVEVVPKLQAYVKNQLEAAGVIGEDIDRYEKANPAWMSVAGLYRYWRKYG